MKQVVEVLMDLDQVEEPVAKTVLQVKDLEKELLVLRLAFGQLKAAIRQAAQPLTAVLAPALTGAVRWATGAVKSLGQVAAGDALTVYREAEGVRRKVGVFLAEKPERASANTLRITAYDPVIRLDKDLTGWLAALDAWPYSLYDLAAMVCGECGLSLANEEIPNGDHPVARFTAEGITGRQLMQWIGEATGRFCRATPDGELEFAWYEPLTTHDIGISPYGGNSLRWDAGGVALSARELAVTEDGKGNVAVEYPLLTVTDDGAGGLTLALAADMQTVMYYQNGLSFSDYAVAPIQKVQLRQSAEDVGAVYPDGIDGAVNTYSITANPLLAALTPETLLPVARTLYEQLQGVTYTPCKVSVPANMDIQAGHILRITDRNGKTITAYVMTKTQQGQKDTLECAGSPSRSSTTATNQRSYQTLAGKVLNLRTDVDGIKAENSDHAGKLSRLRLDVDGILGQVSAQSATAEGLQEQLTAVQQTAGELKVSVQTIKTQGAEKIKTAMGYTFDDEGLRIAKEGQPMENKLNHEGMLVTRNGQTVLQADHRGVTAVDVSVGNYLVVGNHARLEDHGAGRTACFWLEGTAWQ